MSKVNGVIKDKFHPTSFQEDTERSRGVAIFVL